MYHSVALASMCRVHIHDRSTTRHSVVQPGVRARDTLGVAHALSWANNEKPELFHVRLVERTFSSPAGFSLAGGGYMPDLPHEPVTHSVPRTVVKTLKRSHVSRLNTSPPIHRPTEEKRSRNLSSCFWSICFDTTTFWGGFLLHLKLKQHSSNTIRTVEHADPLIQ